MEMTKAQTARPAPKEGGQNTEETIRIKQARTQFVVAAANMGWQLAAVFLVPVLGGHYLDTRLELTPLLTVVGFFVAAGGMAVVLWHQLQLLAPANPIKGSKK
jgi:hypothetical protein